MSQKNLRHALRQHFGFDQFLPGQETVIGHLLSGHSAAAVFPTGGGKSLCYQLPAILLPGVTLVVSPLIALMKDQIDALAARGLAARRVDSTLSADDYRDTMQQVRARQLRLLYVAPERFQNERFREAMQQWQVSLFAVDEAHCISEWGHNFRPDYLKLAGLARQCGAERVLALTATATPPVLQDICRAFDIAPERTVRNSSYRQNLTLLTTPAALDQRNALLISRLRERPPGPTIVYVTLQQTAEDLAARLTAAGFDAHAYHAGFDAQHRGDVQDRFLRSQAGIVVATIAFGMGIDKSDIRYVYHYNLPKSLENYSQEVGRAGRDGQPAVCEALICHDDLGTLENFAYGDTPTRQAVGRFVDEVFRLGDEFDVSHYDLSAQCDIRLLVLRTLLTYLELGGWLSGGTPYFSSYRFKPCVASNEILGHFAGPRREFVARLFKQSKKAKAWFHIDLQQAADALGEPRERVVRALDYLGEQGWLDLQTTGARHRYRRLKVPPDAAALADQLHQQMVRRQQQELARLEQVLEFASADGCQVAALCRHFGDQHTEPCGHCTHCLQAAQPASTEQRRVAAVAENVVQQALVVRAQHGQVLDDPVAMARWLCGLASPALSRAKLTGHPLFGALADTPFDQVRARFADTDAARPRRSAKRA